jgi:predicted CoA-binding protein
MSRPVQILEECRVIAALGAHPDPVKAAHYVPAYLRAQGYRILPVNVRYAGTELFGEPVVPTLADLGEPVDLVNVFRRSDALPSHVDELLALDPPPAVVWFQLGIRNDAVAEQLRAAGIEVVQDLCTLAEHRAAGLRPWG